MLNLLVLPMKRSLLLLPFLFSLLAAQGSPAAAITSPGPGEVLRGEVNITGSTSDPNFLSAQLDFSYASPPVETWFPIQTLTQPVFDSPESKREVFLGCKPASLSPASCEAVPLNSGCFYSYR